MIAVADQLAVALQKANLYSELQISLNQEKAIRSQLIQSERLAVVGRLLASVSHELNNPLQAIQNALFLVKDEEELSEQGRQDMDLILAETERMTAMIERLRAAYRPTRVEDFQDIMLNDMIDDVHALTATQMRHNKITFEFQPDPALSVILGIPDQIRQVILNLFVNAIEAMQTGGKLTVYTQELSEQGKILFSIIDTGPGIDKEILPHIFEPFITNKETGTGLGLSITYDIIRQHNGDIQAENNPACGAAFKVWLPIKRKD
jgi:signal transduction histidine kinase